MEEIKEIKSKSARDKKTYICKAVFNLGSNKDGSPKKKYIIGDKISLNKKQAVIMKNKNRI